jgi:tRNA (guanine37-N1)-methyltransferase
MLMKTQPLADAIDAAQEACIAENGCRAKVVYLSPQGQRIDQALITRAVSEQQLILLCGRYEGIDERLIETQVDEEWSLGDFILSGGELAAMSIMDAMLRLVPGVLGHDQSAGQDSFSDGLLECPQFTRPEDWQGHKVPEVLLSGHHEAIKQWRKAQAEQRTKERRPDLYEKYNQQK